MQISTSEQCIILLQTLLEFKHIIFFIDCKQPPEFSQGSDGYAYFLSDTKEYFEEAKAYCSEKDSVLAYSTNENERLAIYQLLPDVDEEIWIGIKTTQDNDGEQHFTWIETNENIPESNHIEFNFQDNKERCCAAMKKKSNQNKAVIRETNDHKKYFLCQKRSCNECKILDFSF